MCLSVFLYDIPSPNGMIVTSGYFLRMILCVTGRMLVILFDAGLMSKAPKCDSSKLNQVVKIIGL